MSRSNPGIIRFQNPFISNEVRDWPFNFGPQTVSIIAYCRDVCVRKTKESTASGEMKKALISQGFTFNRGDRI